MTISSTGSVDTTAVGAPTPSPADDAQAKSKALQDELKKFEAELDELSKPSSASQQPAKPKGPTSGLVDESA